ncbi:hypothetical protein CEUSTIGMA_g1813.t1 [Chlamydomonas eustigma]|uniref:Sugar phosphate transporter domain-containing protein n=1 Tax=Chlamydomonas eustigma TaxID=1157962 RepID=A0A250WU73_9CHLO|nr:hypothetical protein CEUSTIGMA_g1813.t1 [Chlamydomonas eustigma]|eukprot:GAX74364.1 hypothetical protein CEUSTIGMA_g1813.t1 [Chlamydomonas eustigma]
MMTPAQPTMPLGGKARLRNRVFSLVTADAIVASNIFFVALQRTRCSARAASMNRDGIVTSPDNFSASLLFEPHRRAHMMRVTLRDSGAVRNFMMDRNAVLPPNPPSSNLVCCSASSQQPSPSTSSLTVSQLNSPPSTATSPSDISPDLHVQSDSMQTPDSSRIVSAHVPEQQPLASNGLHLDTPSEQSASSTSSPKPSCQPDALVPDRASTRSREGGINSSPWPSQSSPSRSDVRSSSSSAAHKEEDSTRLRPTSSGARREETITVGDNTSSSSSLGNLHASSSSFQTLTLQSTSMDPEQTEYSGRPSSGAMRASQMTQPGTEDITTTLGAVIPENATTSTSSVFSNNQGSSIMENGVVLRYPTAGSALASKSLLSTLRKQAMAAFSTIKKAAGKIQSILEIGVLLACWYASNILYNIYNKQVLQAFPYATTCTLIHLLVASVFMASLWLFKLKVPPASVLQRRTLLAVFPLSVLHLVGFLTTNMSLGAVNVSLTHTIKSLEPFFTVALSYIFLGTLPSLMVILTLVPIVLGVVIASATDLSFNWYGFLTAMGSNIAFQSRNVMSKKLLQESSYESLEGGDPGQMIDEVNLFACISIAALPMMIPIVFLMDGSALAARFADTAVSCTSTAAASLSTAAASLSTATAAAATAAVSGGNSGAIAVAAAVSTGGGADGLFFQRITAIMPLDVFGRTLMAGVCRTADVLCSYSLLSRLTPVTHSVGNCVKRVVVIAASIVFFKTPASFLNVIGTILALSGVFAYSMAERMAKSKSKVKGPPPSSPTSPSPGEQRLDAFMSAFIPSFIRAAFEKRAAKDAAVTAKLKTEAEKSSKSTAKVAEKPEPPPPEYFL